MSAGHILKFECQRCKNVGDFKLMKQAIGQKLIHIIVWIVYIVVKTSIFVNEKFYE